MFKKAMLYVVHLQLGKLIWKFASWQVCFLFCKKSVYRELSLNNHLVQTDNQLAKSFTSQVAHGAGAYLRFL